MLINQSSTTFVFLSFIQRHCHLKPQYSQTFIIQSNTGFDSKFAEDYEEDVGFLTQDHAIDQSHPDDDVSDNDIPPLPRMEINEVHYTTTHVYQVPKILTLRVVNR